MRDVLELIPESERPDFKEALGIQDKLDTHQLLSDLGYLGREAFEDDQITPDELTDAVAKFRQECRLSLEDEVCTNFRELWRDAAITGETAREGELTQEELLLLKNLTGLEGELVFESFPKTVDVCCRVAFYRFRVYSLIDSRVVPKPNRLSAQIKLLNSILFQYKFDGDVAEFSNILGDQHKLSQFCKSSRFSQEGFIGPVFFFTVKDRKANEFNRLTGEKIKLTKKKDFLPGIKVTKLRTALDKILAAEPRAQINSYIKSNENKFILRVLQVKLWVMGLYQGKLDHDFGPLSLEALKQFLEIRMESSENEEEDLKNILYIINNQQCLINFQYLLENHIMKIEAESNDMNALDDFYHIVQGGYQDHKSIKVRKEAARLDQEVESTMIAHTRKLIGLKKPKRMYKGRSGFRKFISKTISFLKSGIQKLAAFIKKLIKILDKSIKFIFEEIKEAMLTFKRGMSFLFSNRQVKTNDHIYADYDFDFDGHTVLLSTAMPAHVTQHTQEVRLRSEALYPSIHFVIEVVRWGIQFATGMAWIKILIKMAQLLKKLTFDR